MPIQASRNLKYLLLVTSLLVTTVAHSGPLDRSAEFEPDSMISKNRELRLTRQINAREKQESRSQEERKASVHSKKSKKDTSTDRHDKKDHQKNKQSKKHQQARHHRSDHSNNYYSNKRHKGRGGHHKSDNRRNYSYGYNNPWKNQYWGQKGHKQNTSWKYIGEFQTRKHEKESDITLEINDRIKLVEIEGLGRGTVIHRAYLEMKDGRLKRLRDLEGYVERRDTLKQRFRHQRYAQALHLEVSSSGRKRAFAKVNVAY
jgi:hypothetical protein